MAPATSASLGMRPSGTRALSSSHDLLGRHAPPGRGHLDVHVDRGARHPAGDHRVDPDVRGAQLVGQDSGRREERTLGDGVAALGRLGLAGHHRGHVHHRAPAALAEERERRLRHLERAEEVDVHDLAPDGEVDVLEALEDVGAEGVVDHDVDPAELLRRRRHQRRTGVGVDDVRGHGGARAPSAVTSASTSSSLACRRAASTTSAPCAASASAAWRPRPGPTPETTHTLPESRPAAPCRPAASFFVVMGRSVSSGPVSPPAIRAVVTEAWKDRGRVELREGQWRSVGTAGARCPRASAA